ncbi:MAG TPA: hypothetical protein PKO41_04125 [Dokdonella sp.]|nr:hypothetical protein [Dokdonella sp.]
MSDYSAPEMNVERRICGRIRARILRNACAYCIHRDRNAPAGFETCSLFGRRYPLCGTDGRALTFEFDETTLPREAA